MKLLVQTRSSRRQRCYPVRLFLLCLIGPFEPSRPKAPFRRVCTRDGLCKKSRRTEEDHESYKYRNAVAASPSLVHSPFSRIESDLRLAFGTLISVDVLVNRYRHSITEMLLYGPIQTIVKERYVKKLFRIAFEKYGKLVRIGRA